MLDTFLFKYRVVRLYNNQLAIEREDLFGRKRYYNRTPSYWSGTLEEWLKPSDIFFHHTFYSTVEDPMWDMLRMTNKVVMNDE